MITYKVKEVALDPLDSLIEKSGGTVEFTVRKINDDIVYLNKAQKEVDGQVRISKATMENVKRTHPHIAEMKPEDLTAAYLYREALGVVTAGEEKLKQIEAQLKDYAEVKVEIEKQTELKLSESK
jgi:hypothetical protein